MLLRENCDSRAPNKSSGMQKYLITGLANYKLPPAKLCQLVQVMNSKVSYKRNSYFWYVNVETMEIGHGMDGDECKLFG